MQRRLYRSTKLWSFYCDLEESLGSLESTRAVYNRILELRIATPQIILNYALFLQVHWPIQNSLVVKCDPSRIVRSNLQRCSCHALNVNCAFSPPLNGACQLSFERDAWRSCAVDSKMGFNDTLGVKEVTLLEISSLEKKGLSSRELLGRWVGLQ